ncbi:hypothetical protein GDO78_010655 [Eleutherodactylus coqui]|uniref:NUCB1-like N-terminal domain-containing protein n=1 Tax=Eleutherodactylus coqui TaxID=57060 RepID=A0A8J6F4K9_ELECQ|nr:hypothetical protein GDO78_010655 [Eleutherodactylus coqui]
MKIQFLLLCSLLGLSLAVPIDRAPPKTEAEAPQEPADTGLYYDRYLREVIDVLETDNHFREKLQAANADDIKSGKLSKELDFVSHHVRTKLDELKRQEVSRLRMLIKAKMDATMEENIQIDHAALLKQFEHLDPQNQHTFEARDLELLIQTATKDLENYDAAHHEEFKRYEMMKEHERREYLKSLDEDKRRMEEAHYEEMKKKHREHPKVNVPLEKVYNPNNEEDDMVEMEEERLRMREHVMKNVDTNHDRLVTLEEFLKSTERKEFNEAGGWEEVSLNNRAEELRKEHEALQQRQIELDAQKKEYQQVGIEAVIQMEQKKSQPAEAPAPPAVGQNGELKFQAQVPEGAAEPVKHEESHQALDAHPGPPGEHPAPPGEAAQQEKKDSAPSQEHQVHQV